MVDNFEEAKIFAGLNEARFRVRVGEVDDRNALEHCRSYGGLDNIELLLLKL